MSDEFVDMGTVGGNSGFLSVAMLSKQDAPADEEMVFLQRAPRYNALVFQDDLDGSDMTIFQSEQSADKKTQDLDKPMLDTDGGALAQALQNEADSKMAEAADGLTEAPAAHGYGPLASTQPKKAVNKTKAVKKPKPVVVVQKKLSPEEQAAKAAKEKAEAAKKKAEEDEQNKQLEKM